MFFLSLSWFKIPFCVFLKSFFSVGAFLSCFLLLTFLSPTGFILNQHDSIRNSLSWTTSLTDSQTFVPVFVSPQGLCWRLRAGGDREPLNLPHWFYWSLSWSDAVRGKPTSVCTLCPLRLQFFCSICVFVMMKGMNKTLLTVYDEEGQRFQMSHPPS